MAKRERSKNAEATITSRVSGVGWGLGEVVVGNLARVY